MGATIVTYRYFTGMYYNVAGSVMKNFTFISQGNVSRDGVTQKNRNITQHIIIKWIVKTTTGFGQSFIIILKFLKMSMKQTVN